MGKRTGWASIRTWVPVPRTMGNSRLWSCTCFQQCGDADRPVEGETSSPVNQVQTVKVGHLIRKSLVFVSMGDHIYTHVLLSHTDSVHAHTHTHRYTVHTHRSFSREFNVFGHLFKSFSSSLSMLIHSRRVKLPLLVFSLSNLKHHWGLHKLCFHQEIFPNNLLPSVSPESLSIFTG